MLAKEHQFVREFSIKEDNLSYCDGESDAILLGRGTDDLFNLRVAAETSNTVWGGGQRHSLSSERAAGIC